MSNLKLQNTQYGLRIRILNKYSNQLDLFIQWSNYTKLLLKKRFPQELSQLILDKCHSKYLDDHDRQKIYIFFLAGRHGILYPNILNIILDFASDYDIYLDKKHDNQTVLAIIENSKYYLLNNMKVKEITLYDSPWRDYGKRVNITGDFIDLGDSQYETYHFSYIEFFEYGGHDDFRNRSEIYIWNHDPDQEIDTTVWLPNERKFYLLYNI